MSDQKNVSPDWAKIEIDFRAGIKTLRQIAEEHGITHGAINKRAKRDEWTRDIAAKIKAKAEEKVSKAAVSKEVSKERAYTEKVVVEANAQIVAGADLANRLDVDTALGINRGLMSELAGLSNPAFFESLERLGELMDESYTDDNGREVKDKVNEMYRYIISLPGRIKMAKELAAAHSVYIPMQRKILKLDAEADRSQAEIDNLIKLINAE